MAPSSCMLAYDLRSLLRSAFLTTVGPSSIPTGSSSLRASFSSYSLRSPTFLAGSSFPTSLRFSSQQRTTLPSRRSFHVSPARSAFVLDSSHHDQVVQILKAKIEDRAELVKQAEEALGVNARESSKLGRKLKNLDPLKEAYDEYLALTESITESETLLNDSDPTMREMAEEEIASAHQALDTLLSRTVPPLLLPPLPSSSLSCILEVKAGAGGDEAALFTEEIRSMYLKFAQAQGWKAKVLSETEQGIKGIRESHIEIKGDGAYGKLRWEGGVHRVQRIPVTESKGRMQTSTMAVIVLPIDENPQVDDLAYVDEKEVKVEVMRASGAGGQHVNKTESAVRLTHIPTKISVSMQDNRSQHQNRADAWVILRGRLYAARLAEKQAQDRITRKSQIPGMDRGDRVRTWNYPGDYIRDHRAEYTATGVGRVLAGPGLEEIVQILADYHLTLRLRGLLEGVEIDAED